VQRDDVADLQLAGQPVAACSDQHPPYDGFAEPKPAVVVQQRLPAHVGNLAVEGGHRSRRDPATVEHAQWLSRGSGPQQPGPWVDSEHMEVVVRPAT
jgi:hypothetical protein